jgi:hypothetical protein
MISHARLKEVLRYDAETGHFYWLARMGCRALKGARAGTTKEDGYRIVFIDRVRYSEHRLAWFYMTGRWPTHDIDHRNNLRGDNRFANLREATRAQNAANSPARRPNPIGLRGVSPASKSSAYQARISANGVEHYLGCFASPEEAHAAYCDAAKRLHGEFARTK